MPAITNVKWHRVVGICCTILGVIFITQFRISRASVQNPLRPDGALGIVVPTEIEQLNPPSLAELSSINLVAIHFGWSVLSPSIFVARQATKFATAEGVTNVELEAVPHCSKLRNAASIQLCTVASLMLTWAPREYRVLGCGIAVDSVYELKDDGRATVRRFQRLQWCAPCNAKNKGKFCSSGMLSDGACDLVARASQTFHILTRKTKAFSDVITDQDANGEPQEGVGNVNRREMKLGAMCMQWSAAYTMRMANTVLNILAQTPDILSRSQQTVLTRSLGAVRRALDLGEHEGQDNSRLELIEAFLRHEDTLGLIHLAASEQFTLGPSNATLRKNMFGRSVIDLLARQRARISPEPLSPSSSIRLSSGVSMPLIGLGTAGGRDCYTTRTGWTREWEGDKDLGSSMYFPVLDRLLKMPTCGAPSAEFVATAILRHGVRMVDTAPLYGSELRVFEGVHQAIVGGVQRKDIFVMTKTWPPRMERSGVASVLQGGDRGVHLDFRLDDSRLSFVDLYTEHHAFEHDRPEWNRSDWYAMQKFKRRGLTRSLGVSAGWLPGADISQERLHPADTTGFGGCHPQSIDPIKQELIDKNVTLVNINVALEASHDPVLRQLAKLKGVTAIQYAIRWSLQIGMPVLIQTNSLAHLQRNLDVFGFVLTDREMALIDVMMECGTFDDLVTAPS
eukprot:m.91485 g.91485  ORF g.91485 m.91485 type:complete len:679 (+) comp11942_c0_seq1:123-2159(+)